MLLKCVAYWIATLSAIFYLISTRGLHNGVWLFFLNWSLLILCIPGSHGQILFGYPIFAFTSKQYYIEALLWVAAIILNIFTYILQHSLYATSIPSYLLHRFITTPIPYWSIIGISTCGTFYFVLMKDHFLTCKKFKYLLIRHLLILIGLANFLYLAHQEIILFLNASI